MHLKDVLRPAVVKRLCIPGLSGKKFCQHHMLFMFL